MLHVGTEPIGDYIVGKTKILGSVVVLAVLAARILVFPGVKPLLGFGRHLDPEVVVDAFHGADRVGQDLSEMQVEELLRVLFPPDLKASF
jgi:hypothetical protein